MVCCHTVITTPSHCQSWGCPQEMHLFLKSKKFPETQLLVNDGIFTCYRIRQVGNVHDETEVLEQGHSGKHQSGQESFT